MATQMTDHAYEN